MNYSQKESLPGIQFIIMMFSRSICLLGGSLWRAGVVCILGSPVHPVSGSVRFVLAFYWLFCIVLVATYSGNIISFLAVAKPVTPFNNLVELVALEDYIISIYGGYQSFFEVCITANYNGAALNISSSLKLRDDEMKAVGTSMPLIYLHGQFIFQHLI